jgi:hypothetical protein
MIADHEHQTPPAAPSRPGPSTEDLYRAAIGPNGQNHYVSRFLRFDAAGRSSVSWNWPALFFTFYWMLYRKMWRAAAVYFALPYVLMTALLVGVSLTGAHSNTLAIGLFEIVYLIASIFLPALYADSLYYRHCRMLISKTVKSEPDPQQQLVRIGKKGGTSNVALIGVVVFFFFGIGCLSAIAIPAYQDYVTRARVAQAEVDGRIAAGFVANYYNAMHKVPGTFAEAGFLPKPSAVVSLYDLTQDGVVSVTIASGLAKDRRLLLVPIMNDAGDIHWRCLSRDIPRRHLPRGCAPFSTSH